MSPLVLISLFVAASAAPQFFDHHPHFNHHRHPSPFQDDIFNTEHFWDDLSKELRALDDVLADFYNKFPSSVSREGIEGNEYKITIPLNGFDEKDIVVKAREGMLMVQAIHKTEDNIERNYLDVRTLPICVDVKGSWTYENQVLKIVFPLKAGSQNPVEETTEVVTTEGYKEYQSREEMENTHESNDVNADVGLERGDQTPDANDDLRNRVEATTYAVDLKDEVEFVPVRY